ncbi:serine protease inhibitor Kazal-type 1-like isoform X5 [Anguilla anguilla]|uniref:serine protease inhibitor Kazal-type 1-like isoform X5 n=1 Tax=Anguilla anguilla TaxID=7936 RepID=UPI0015A8B4DD|nr:serine protease inhibitor Kazal-type 1-like isoform X5 [Anguilla anguilla]
MNVTETQSSEIAAPSIGLRVRGDKPRCTADAEKGKCPTNWSPVCGTDRVTYKNECELCRANLRKTSKVRIRSRYQC